MADVGRKAKQSHLKEGEFLKIRTALERQQRDIAAWLDTSVNTVSMMEIGKLPVPKPVAILMKLAKAGTISIPEAKDK
jgi:DNA-binding transcriptional regulator YiaG